MLTGRIGTRYILTAHRCGNTHLQLALPHPVVHHTFTLLGIHCMLPAVVEVLLILLTATACFHSLVHRLGDTLIHALYAFIHACVQCSSPVRSMSLSLPPSLPPFFPSILPSCLPSFLYTLTSLPFCHGLIHCQSISQQSRLCESWDSNFLATSEAFL